MVKKNIGVFFSFLLLITPYTIGIVTAIKGNVARNTLGFVI